MLSATVLEAPPPAPSRPARVSAPRPRPTEAPRSEAPDQSQVQPNGEATSVAPPYAPPNGTGAASAEPPPTEPPQQQAAIAPPEAPRQPRWRVAADRTVGCAVPEAVRMLRGAEGLRDAPPRLAAQTRREGGCATTFRVSEWTLLRADGELVLLRLANPPPGVPAMELYFLRRDVVSPPGDGSPPSG